MLLHAGRMSKVALLHRLVIVITAAGIAILQKYNILCKMQHRMRAASLHSKVDIMQKHINTQTESQSAACAVPRSRCLPAASWCPCGAASVSHHHHNLTTDNIQKHVEQQNQKQKRCMCRTSKSLSSCCHLIPTGKLKTKR
jgi:hypothetical protein